MLKQTLRALQTNAWRAPNPKPDTLKPKTVKAQTLKPKPEGFIIGFSAAGPAPGFFVYKEPHNI